ncbi:MAG: hypothetical protein ABI151_12560, partial [Chitinophagaceae bacterium]
MKPLFIIIGLAFYFLGETFTPFSTYECLSFSLFVYAILSFVDDLGKKMVMLDVAILIAIITCLLLPIAGYHHFNFLNASARMWVIYMRVPSDQYYSFMFPATIAMIVGMKIPVFFKNSTYPNQETYMLKVKAYLSKSRWQGLILVSIGVFSSVIQKFVPSSIAFVFFLLSYLMFVGIFYCLYSKIPYKRLILTGVFGLLAIRSISAGMFGEMVFISALTVILLALGYKISFPKKLGILLTGMFAIMILQAVKPAFRKQTWAGRSQGREISIFAEVLGEKIRNPFSFVDDERVLFTMYGRFNQGQIISNVLYSVPSRFP